MAALKKAANALGLVFLVALFGVAIAGEDNSMEWVVYLAIVFGAIALTNIGKPKPVGIGNGRTRKSLVVPAYVENAMIGRWIVLIVGGLLAGALDSMLLWAICIAAFILMTEYASRRYQKENPEEWEIAFHNEVDGYSNSDGDGDGD